jgi:hypothetical protein
MLLTEHEIQAVFRERMYDPVDVARELERLVAEKCAAVCESDAGMTAHECASRIRLALLREPSRKPARS